MYVFVTMLQVISLFFLVFCGVAVADTNVYHTFDRDVLCEEEYQYFEDLGVAPFCTIEVKDCNATEGRRLDGSCNNLRNPTMGASYTPQLRFLPADFADGLKKPRKSMCGMPLVNAREARTKFLFEGTESDQTLTQLASLFWNFFSGDSNFAQDTNNYRKSSISCCSPGAKEENEKCLKVEIPSKDPVHRFSGIRCMNLTQPLSYQNTGCIRNGTLPEERINAATPLIDLSTVYGNKQEEFLKKQRLGKDGLMVYEELNGYEWPPSSEDSNLCYANEAPFETRCHDTADVSTNALIGKNLGVIWFYRQHNRLARELKKYNPCWDDEKVFSAARDLNIALASQVFYYELMPLLLGKENMIRDNVISASSGHREVYNESVLPQLVSEYLYALRWAHTIIDGNMKLYNTDGDYYKSFPMLNATFRTGWLAIDDNIGGLTRGLFRQAASKANNLIVDPDMAELGYPGALRMHDILTADLFKGRLFGYKPYVDYLKHCTGKTINTFEDLIMVMDKERIELVQSVYKHLRDIDLMAGMWLERSVKGGIVPTTVYCLVVEQLKLNVVSDRHWYERKNRPNAYTEKQLKEIRKASIGRLLCKTGDNVTRIQPRPFERPGPGNEIDDCEKTTLNIKMSVFKDDSCSRQS